MRRMFIALLLCGCGPGNTGHRVIPGDGMDTDTDMATAMTGTIPAPGTGNGVDNNFGSVANDSTPGTATPLGASTGTGDINVWVDNNTVAGSPSSDYFVFESASMPGMFTFNICANGSITAMAATLWKVANGQEVLPPVHQWSAATACVMSAPTGDAPLEANTEYLFEVEATGGAGSYSA